ncbi:hypothetical protein [Jiangella alba]|uniref:hypothetical protein n=1 Tax=Jiangella alba TaxID=561176 RepID=UPI001FDFAAF6|nr:hypothetical protein [Jiangella alba]
MVTERVVGTAEVTPRPAREGAGAGRPAGPAVALAGLLTLALHLLYVTGPLLSDEGGLAMVARWWGSGGEYLYGPQWVDRPPGLIATFWVANLLGPYGVRIVAGLLAAAFVLAAGWAGWAARGARAATWSAWAAFFLMNSPLTQTFALNGELVAATWTMAGVAAGIHAVRGRVSYRSAVALGALAGTAAAAAMLAKQNFADAAVFLLVLGLAEGLTGRVRRRRLLAVAGAAGAGFALPVAAAAGWAYTHTGLGDLVYAMYGFRVDASMVIARSAYAGPDSRLRELLGIALLSGIVTLAIAVVVAGRRQVRRCSPLFLACAAAGLVEVAGVALGGNYSPHYLIGLAPMLALAAGVLAVQPGRGRWLVRLFVVVPVVATLIVSPAAAVQVTRENTVQATGEWLERAAERGDSVAVLYTHANVVNASGLRPAYPYAWSLPVRTLDPQLTLLAATLTDPRRAPTWVVGWDALRTWDLDAHRVARALATDYVRFATVCDHPVWLRRGLDRTEPPDPCAGTGIQESSIESAGRPAMPGSLPVWTSSPGARSRSSARGRSSPAGPARSPGWSSPSGCSTGASAGASATTRRASST